MTVIQSSFSSVTRKVGNETYHKAVMFWFVFSYQTDVFVLFENRDLFIMILELADRHKNWSMGKEIVSPNFSSPF